jgi:hypothetical protein
MVEFLLQTYDLWNQMVEIINTSHKNNVKTSMPFHLWKTLSSLGYHRAILDEGPKFQWNRTILLAESHKFDSRPLDERPRPKSGKSRLNLHGTHFGGRFNWFRPKTKTKEKGAQTKACDLENQDARALGCKTKKWQIKSKTYIRPFWKEIQLIQTQNIREN